MGPVQSETVNIVFTFPSFDCKYDLSVTSVQCLLPYEPLNINYYQVGLPFS